VVVLFPIVERTVTISISVRGEATNLVVPYGTVLRNVLLANALSPYRETNRILNCHGLGICGTCQVLLKEGDRRERMRSCQIRCFRDLEIELE
jgi:ferredoxin